MFTGIIEGKGRLSGVSDRGGHRVLQIDLGPLTEDVPIGASIAVSGVCLTVTTISSSVCSFDVIRETLERTSLSKLRVGSMVNVERAMLATSRLDGHIVQGHVDGTGSIRRKDRQSGQTLFEIEAARDLLAQMVLKGSITVDGVSLTLTAVDATSFCFAAIPHTLEVTTLGERRAGDTVNLETDVIGKWVKRIVEPYLGTLGRS